MGANSKWVGDLGPLARLSTAKTIVTNFKWVSCVRYKSIEILGNPSFNPKKICTID
jgi:hypothetical protein